MEFTKHTSPGTSAEHSSFRSAECSAYDSQMLEAAQRTDVLRTQLAQFVYHNAPNEPTPYFHSSFVSSSTLYSFIEKELPRLYAQESASILDGACGQRALAELAPDSNLATIYDIASRRFEASRTSMPRQWAAFDGTLAELDNTIHYINSNPINTAQHYISIADHLCDGDMEAAFQRLRALEVLYDMPILPSDWLPFTGDTQLFTRCADYLRDEIPRQCDLEGYLSAAKLFCGGDMGRAFTLFQSVAILTDNQRAVQHWRAFTGSAEQLDQFEQHTHAHGPLNGFAQQIHAAHTYFDGDLSLAFEAAMILSTENTLENTHSHWYSSKYAPRIHQKILTTLGSIDADYITPMNTYMHIADTFFDGNMSYAYDCIKAYAVYYEHPVAQRLFDSLEKTDGHSSAIETLQCHIQQHLDRGTPPESMYTVALYTLGVEDESVFRTQYNSTVAAGDFTPQTPCTTTHDTQQKRQLLHQCSHYHAEIMKDVREKTKSGADILTAVQSHEAHQHTDAYRAVKLLVTASANASDALKNSISKKEQPLIDHQKDSLCLLIHATRKAAEIDPYLRMSNAAEWIAHTVINDIEQHTSPPAGVATSVIHKHAYRTVAGARAEKSFLEALHHLGYSARFGSIEEDRRQGGDIILQGIETSWYIDVKSGSAATDTHTAHPASNLLCISPFKYNDYCMYQDFSVTPSAITAHADAIIQQLPKAFRPR